MVLSSSSSQPNTLEVKGKCEVELSICQSIFVPWKSSFAFRIFKLKVWLTTNEEETGEEEDVSSDSHVDWPIRKDSTI